MLHKTLKQDIKNVDSEITIVKLIESNYKERLTYTIEFKQGNFVSELQFNQDVNKCFSVFYSLKNVDVYLDKFTDRISSKKRTCNACGALDTMLYSFDDNVLLCENCASQNNLI